MPDKITFTFCAIEDEDYKKKKILWWENVYGFDMSVLREQAIQEPLIDEVKPRQIVTNNPVIGVIDLYTVNSLSFSFSFNLRGLQNDFVHGFLTYFTVYFFSHPERVKLPESFSTLRFSTGPRAAETHWQQTLMYIKDVLLVSKGDKIIGHLWFSPKRSDGRKLEIKLSYEFHGTYGHLKATHSYVL